MADPIQYGPIPEPIYVHLFPAESAAIEVAESKADFVASIVDLDAGQNVLCDGV